MVEKTDASTMFRKPYKMRSVGDSGLNTVVSIPRLVLQREADKREISVEDFIKNYMAIAIFDTTDGFYYIFEPIGSKEE